MKKKLLTLLCLGFAIVPLYAPPNCEVFRDDPPCYGACEEAMRAIRYRQGSWQSQSHFDKSLALCATFAYSYMEKAVPFLKRGDFITWKKLIDRAVELEPAQYLGYRGWCRLQFLRDYEGAIADIEELQNLVDYDIGYCQTGDYHLEVALALCYKELGQKQKAKQMIESKLREADYYLGPYDYYHLGVLAYELGHYQEAIEYLNRQIAENDYLGETYYFRALAHRALGAEEAFRTDMEQAGDYYRQGSFRTDTYCETIDKIYLRDIEEALNQAR